MNQHANIGTDRDNAFAPARQALARAHHRHIQVRQHRAINHLTIGPYLLLQALALPALFCGLLVWAQPLLFDLWREYILVWAKQLDIPLAVNDGTGVVTRLGLAWAPTDPSSDLPSTLTLLITTALTLAAFAMSYALNGRMFPLKVLLRIFCGVQGFALAFFWFFSSSFPYGISNHANDLTSMGYVLLLAIPVMLSIGYYVLHIGLGTKIIHTLLILLYFVIMVPFQVIAHVLILQHFSLLFMPILYICFGTLFDMLLFVALYSWAASTASAQATT